MYMLQKEIAPAVEALRTGGYSVDNLAPIEVLAEACGIDINAPFSYREVVEMAEAVSACPHIGRIWREVDGKMVRGYFPTASPLPVVGA